MSRPTLVILAGGKGTRLGELTKDTPKPMVDIFGKPFLYWLIKHYLEQGFTDIVVSTGYKAEVIEEYPWPWTVNFMRDNESFNGAYDYYRWPDCEIVVNGDTWIEESLPTEEGPWVCTHYDLDAGAQRGGVGKIKVLVRSFFDMGTPSGLHRFKSYFKTHPYYLTHVDKK